MRAVNRFPIIRPPRTFLDALSAGLYEHRERWEEREESLFISARDMRSVRAHRNGEVKGEVFDGQRRASPTTSLFFTLH